MKLMFESSKLSREKSDRQCVQGTVELMQRKEPKLLKLWRQRWPAMLAAILRQESLDVLSECAVSPTEPLNNPGEKA